MTIIESSQNKSRTTSADDDDYDSSWANLPDKLMRGKYEMHTKECNKKCKSVPCIQDFEEVSHIYVLFALINILHYRVQLPIHFRPK